MTRNTPSIAAAALETLTADPPPRRASTRRGRRGAGPGPVDPAQIQRVLRKTFHIRRLREGQERVIQNVLAGHPTLAIMPTGAGKSLCYQLPAMLLPGLTLVVSPLIALMKDQCDALAELGVAAVQLNSSLGARELDSAEAAIRDHTARIVFTTPERLADPAFLDLVSAREVSLLVVDEAHCVSQWGHDFRPAFLEIGAAVAPLGHPTLLALTATATDAVVDDIAKQLGVARFRRVHTGMYRRNLEYAVEQVTREDDKLARTLALVKAAPGSGIVYAATIKAVEAVHDALAAAGESVGRYHGRLGPAERHASQEAFMSDAVRVMVATNAFGLGIDKPDLRFVLHYQMPAGLDAYYQESGRGGRDGETARCVLLYLHSDRAVQQFFLAGRYPAQEDLADVYTTLRQDRPEGEPWTLEAIQQHLDRPKSKVQVALRLLRHQRVVRQDREGRLRLCQGALDPDALATLSAAYRDKRESDRSMLEQMVFYGQTGYCRWKVLLAHFEEDADFERCGACDNCLRMAAQQAQAAVDTEASPDPLRHPLPATVRVDVLAKGSAVRVPRYGLGVVESADSQSVTVSFPNGSQRCFLASYVHAGG